MMCAVKSRPRSTFKWFHGPEVIGVAYQTMKVKDYYYYTNATYTVTRTSFDMDKMNITCTAHIRFGRKVIQSTFLYVTGKSYSISLALLTANSWANMNYILLVVHSKSHNEVILKIYGLTFSKNPGLYPWLFLQDNAFE